VCYDSPFQIGGNDLTLKDVLEIGAAVITGLGGGGAIVFGLSGHLGKVWADRALEKQKQDYAQLNITFNHQLDLATRRIQVELDALGHLHKLRTEVEFQKIAELWKSLVRVERSFYLLPRADDAFGGRGTPEQLHSNRIDRSIQFSKDVIAASFFWREEALTIPKELVDDSGPLLAIAYDEQELALTHPDPYQSIADSKERSEFFEKRAKRARDFSTATNKLLPVIREYSQGTKKASGVPSSSSE